MGVVAVIRALVCMFACVFACSAAFAADCTSGQVPYSITYDSLTGSGYSREEACAAWSELRHPSGWIQTPITGASCVSRDTSYGNVRTGPITGPSCVYPPASAGSSSVSGTVTAVFPQMTSGDVADYMSLWGLFLAAGVGVLCAQALYVRIFRLNKYEG